MKPKETLYSLSRKFNIKMKRILKDNPEYDVSRPIAEGAVVKLALRQIDRNVLEAELRWEKRQAKEVQQARREEMEKYEKSHSNTFPPARDSLEGMVQQVVGDTVFVIPEVAREQRHVKVALMLPLYVKENKLPLSEEEIPVDTLGVNIRNEHWRLSSRTEPFLQFYQGVLMAVDSLKRLGYTIDLYVYDTERDPNTVQRLVGELNLLSPDLIIGPVYANTYKAVAEQLGNRTIPMIFPLSSRGGDLVRFPNFVQLNTSTVSLVEEMADWIVANGTQAHLINIIPDGGGRASRPPRPPGGAGPPARESRLTDLVRTRLQANGMEDMTNCQWRPQMHLDSLRKVMRLGVENIILFPTINEAAASRTLPVLSALADQFRITVIGFPDWLKFTSIDEEVLFVIGYIVLNRLEKYTNHGYYITVPELRGLTPDEAKPFAKEKNLQILVIDSIYDNNAKPGTIVEQFPSPNAHVKNNRAIQLTINANAPEKIIFPNLRNVAFRQSLQRLKNLGLNVGRIEYIPSNFKNLVLDFKYEGNIIEPNSLIQKGETVDIVLGNGNTSNDQVAIPSLVGKTLAEAKAILLRAFLNVGEILPDNTIKTEADQSTAIIYQQEP